MPKALVRGVKTHYQQAGTGPDVVLLHGLGANLAFWYLGAMPLLAAANRVTAYDLRGHGLSGRPRTGYTTTELAADLAGLLDELEIDRPSVVGHSYGGAVALHAAVLHPQRLAGVVVADGYLPCAEPASRRLPGLRMRRMVRGLRRQGVDLPRDLPRVAYGLIEEIAHAQHASAEGSEAAPWSSLELSGDAWRRLREQTTVVPDVYDRSLTVDLIRRIGAPVKAVYGQRTTCRATLRGLRGALPAHDIAVLPGCGHLHPLLKPAQFTAATVNSLRCSSAPPP